MHNSLGSSLLHSSYLMIPSVFVRLQRKLSSGEHTQEMTGNTVALMKDQTPPTLEDIQIPDKNITERGFSFLYHRSQCDLN